jgi:hypothetical protein
LELWCALIIIIFLWEVKILKEKDAKVKGDAKISRKIKTKGDAKGKKDAKKV